MYICHNFICNFIWRGILIAMKAPDMFGSLVATGITALVGIQVIINIAVVTSSMPGNRYATSIL